MSAIIIRDAITANIQAISELHVDVWRATYRQLAPPQAHLAIDVPMRLKLWTRFFESRPHQSHLLVAVSGPTMTGFCCGGPSTHPIFAGRAEIKTLYVRQEQHGSGIGRLLFLDTCARLARDGHTGMGLTVVRGNGRAIAFYEKLGGRQAGTFTDPGPIWKSENVLYVWDDLEALLTKAP